MPIVIGAKPESDFTDPIGMLGDCHRRIVRFLHVLAALATQYQGGPLPEDHSKLLDTSLRYFREGAPKHTADEEESLFPRLRKLDALGTDAVLARIDALEQDHERAERTHAEVDRLGRMWLSEGRLSAADAAQWEKLTGELVSLYRDHIGAEDTEVFPFAARVLPAADRQAIGAEMKARRGLGGI